MRWDLRRKQSVPVDSRTCYSSPFSLHQPQIHLLCLCAGYRRNDKRRHSPPTNRQDELVFPWGGEPVHCLLALFQHSLGVFVTWKQFIACVVEYGLQVALTIFWFQKRIQGILQGILRNLFYCFRFYLEKDKVKAHVVTSSLRGLICKWNFNFRWICVHPPQAFIFLPHRVNFFFLSIMFFLPSLLPPNILWCCQHRWKLSRHRWRGDGIHVLSGHELQPVPAWTQALRKAQTPHS